MVEQQHSPDLLSAASLMHTGTEGEARLAVRLAWWKFRALVSMFAPHQNHLVFPHPIPLYSSNVARGRSGKQYSHTSLFTIVDNDFFLSPKQRDVVSLATETSFCSWVMSLPVSHTLFLMAVKLCKQTNEQGKVLQPSMTRSKTSSKTGVAIWTATPNIPSFCQTSPSNTYECQLALGYLFLKESTVKWFKHIREIHLQWCHVNCS